MPTQGDLDDIRNGIATALTTIGGLRASADLGATINPPIALVAFPDPIEYDQTLGHESDVYTIPVQIFVATSNMRAGILKMTGYLDKTGTSSVKVAIEADSTLGGACSSLRVLRARATGLVDVGDVPYLVATWDVEVYA
jgi:hypothetical protein